MSGLESQFQLNSVVMYKNTGRETLTITATVLELELHESLDQPFLTGLIAVSDAEGKIANFGLSGTEFLEFTLTNIQFEVSITKRFVISSTEIKVSSNEMSEFYVLNLMEEHAVVSSLSVFSKSYTGTPDQIIKRIVTGKLNKQLLIGNLKPIQDPITVVTPYITALDAIAWINNRATTLDGHPYFVYSTIKDDFIRMRCIDEMAADEPFNKQPFTYGTAASVAGQLVKSLHAIKTMDIGGSNDLMTKAVNGGLAVKYEAMDIVTGNRARRKNIKPTNMGKELTSAIFKDRRVFDSMNQIIFDFQNPSYETSSGYGGGNIDTLSTKMKRVQTAARYNENKIGFTMNGAVWMANDKARVGMPMDIRTVELDGALLLKEDKQKSGKFVVTYVCHRFSNNKHEVDVIGIRP